MRNAIPCAVVALLALMISSCASTPASMPVTGSPTDVALLAGEWNGEYWGAANGRSGTITFHLESRADTAQGHVTMINRRPLGPGATSTATRTNPAQMATEALTVTFVHAEGGGVSGRLDPYTDPDCNCTAFTTFDGRIHGSVIEGTYTTFHGTGTATSTGKWKVKRKKT
jgi:hypothetical protein